MHDSSHATQPLNLLRSLLVLVLAAAVVGCAGAGHAPSWSQPPSTSNAGPAPAAIVRGQSPEPPSRRANQPAPGSNEHWRYGIPTADATESAVQPAQYQSPPPRTGAPGGGAAAPSPGPYATAPASPYVTNPYAAPPSRGAPAAGPSPWTVPGQPATSAPGGGFAPPPVPQQPSGFLLPQAPPAPLPSVLGPDPTELPPASTVPWDVIVEEARTGQFMIGVGVNSDAGVTGQVILDERNFDWTRVPTSLDDIVNGTAFRGAGQGFRLEAVPGRLVQRYLVSFTEPYLFDTQISLNLSGFFFDRRYFDWDEQRLGGRVALGYRLTPDLSFTTALRMENVKVHNPRVRGVPELEDVLGNNALYSPRFSLTHDTRDVPFLPTEGHFIEMSFEQVFGTYNYPRGELDYRKYFLVTERPDGSGRHTLSYGMRLGVTGSQTPVFENFFAGGFSTLRGFDFRGASPVSGGVRVGGEFRFLGSLEYMFPLSADDMIRGVVFCDFGTVEERVQIEWEDFRVAPGLGLRISIPALGPAPIALDFAVPVAREKTDDIENFSFFFGFGRS